MFQIRFQNNNNALIIIGEQQFQEITMSAFMQNYNIILIAIDVIAVAYYNKGPFFAIPGVQYKDGGTREYYGLGYKVISYHQVQGRRDKELGFWNLEYNTSAITIKDIDLAIGMVDKGEEFYQKYKKWHRNC